MGFLYYLIFFFGCPSSSKKYFFLGHFYANSTDGAPIISIIRFIYSISSSPGNIGVPIYNSEIRHAKLHISISVLYFKPNITSGAL